VQTIPPPTDRQPHSRSRTSSLLAPSARTISVPVSVVAGISRAARDGILIKGGVYLERLAGIRSIAFDKTGTLTVGRPTLTDVVPLDGLTRDEVLRLAAAVEAASEHPLAAAAR
jgi:Cd2+/Zn2+-exporting ATPase